MSPLQLELRAIIAGQIGISESILREDMALEDIGLDSMQIAEIVIAIERRATKRIDLADLADHLDGDPSLGQLLRVFERKLVEFDAWSPAAVAHG